MIPLPVHMAKDPNIEVQYIGHFVRHSRSILPVLLFISSGDLTKVPVSGVRGLMTGAMRQVTDPQNPQILQMMQMIFAT